MPIGSQSLVPYNQTIFTAVNGTQYKGLIDAATSVLSNSSGSLYVFPNSPAALSVLVDKQFTLPQIGQTASHIFNSGSGYNTVAIPAPGANSYYACVYWDLLAVTTGVIFGATSASPVPRVPSSLWQVPLAFVLVANGQTSINVSNIFDARSWIQPGPLAVDLGTVAVNTAVNCQNASSVAVRVSFSNVAGFQLTLSNVRSGCTVNLFIQNASGSTASSIVLSTNPTATPYVVNAITPGGVTIWSSAGISQANTTYLSGSGAAVGANIFFTLT